MKHPDVDELADLVEGDLLSPERAAELQAHVAGCADCAGLVEAIRMVPATLADLPVVALPPLAAERLDAVLRTESARRKESASSTESAPRAPVTRERPDSTGTAPVVQLSPGTASSSAPARAASGWSQRHPRLRTAAAAAASVAVLGGAAALVAPQLSGSSSETQSAESAGGSAAESADGAGVRRGDALRADRIDATARRLAREVGRGSGAAPTALGMVEGLRVGMRPS